MEIPSSPPSGPASPIMVTSESPLSKRPVCMREDVDFDIPMSKKREGADSETTIPDSESEEVSSDYHEESYVGKLKIKDEDLLSEESLMGLYKRWMEHWDISRDEAEVKERFPLFKKLANEIHEFNNNKATWKKGLHPFADSDPDEIVKTMFCEFTTSDEEGG